MRRPLIAANWKMNKTIAEAEAFASELAGAVDRVPHCDLLVCPPFFALPAVARALSETRVTVGAQDLFWEESGAYTGEVSGAMVADAGAGFVLVGHSERRHVIGEDNNIVARKLAAAVAAGLTPILCVGELLAEREAGRHQDVVATQIATAFDAIDASEAGRIVIAYEPVWAIGTGRTATPDDAQAMHALIRRQLRERFGNGVADAAIIQYGGSVKPDNAAGLLGCEDIDGALVGGASLQVDSFLGIAAGAAGA